MRAQRLSASEIQHLSRVSPFAWIARVLNAFRHQRFNTFTNSPSTSSSHSAQRLSASEIQHALRVTYKSEVECAQRLSASEIQHISKVYFLHSKKKCSTPFGIRDSTPIRARFSSNHLQPCSTPFGIRDSTLAGFIFALL